MPETGLKVLLVPDSIHWVTGTIARSILQYNPWIRGCILSGSVLPQVAEKQPEFLQVFDLVHFTCPYASREWLPRFAPSVPCVTSHHHVVEWDLLKHNLEGDAIVVGSRQWEEDLLQRGVQPERIYYLPYGVDTRQYQPASDDQRRAARRRFGIPATAPVVGFFAKRGSNEGDRKGTDVFTSAIIELARELPQVVLLLVGPGWQELVEELRRRNVQCIWRPFIPTAEGLAQVYQVLDFYWITARVEGGHVTLLEAMSSGVCPLTTPVGLALELIEPQVNGLLLPMNQPRAFVESTLQLWSRPDRRAEMGARARATMVERMEVSRVTQEVRGLYTRAFQAYARRTGRPPRVPTAPSSSPLMTPELPAMNGSIPWHSLDPACVPPEVARRVPLLEDIIWAESLVVHGQRRNALAILARRCLAYPTDKEPWRALLRHLLPRAVVRSIVAMRHRRPS